jgi:hypothetical protein
MEACLSLPLWSNIRRLNCSSDSHEIQFRASLQKGAEYEFCENLLIDNRSLVKGFHEFMLVFCILHDLFNWHLV